MQMHMHMHNHARIFCMSDALCAPVPSRALHALTPSFLFPFLLFSFLQFPSISFNFLQFSAKHTVSALEHCAPEVLAPGGAAGADGSAAGNDGTVKLSPIAAALNVVRSTKGVAVSLVGMKSMPHVAADVAVLAHAKIADEKVACIYDSAQAFAKAERALNTAKRIKTKNNPADPNQDDPNFDGAESLSEGAGAGVNPDTGIDITAERAAEMGGRGRVRLPGRARENDQMVLPDEVKNLKNLDLKSINLNTHAAKAQEQAKGLFSRVIGE